MSKSIFSTPPLSKMAPKKADATSRLSPAKPRAQKTAKVTEIPQAEPYRIDHLGRGRSGSGATGAAAGDKWKTQAMRSHRSPTFLWFTRGQGRITVSGVTRGFGPHNLIFLPTRTMYGFEPIGHVYGYRVHLPELPSLNLPNEPLHMRFRDVMQQNEITGLIDGLQREIDGDHPSRARALELQAGLISVWLERQISIMPEYDLTPDASRKLAAAFTALVEDKFVKTHTIADYAADLGVTPTHLSRACNVACGHPASAILADRIHFEARRMLKETDLPIAKISQKLGFHSPAYFSRAFHKNTGKSPRDFRKS